MFGGVCGGQGPGGHLHHPAARLLPHHGLLQMVQHGVLSTAGTNFSKLKKFFGKLGMTGIEPW